MKNLILITNSFPFGLGEASFIRPEISELEKRFDITVVSRNTTDEQTTVLPENVKICRYDAKKGYSAAKLLIKTILTPAIYSEIAQLVKKREITPFKIKKLLRYYMRALHFADYLGKIRDTIDGDAVLYTYWNDYSVLSASMVKLKGDRLISRAHRADLYFRRENGMYLPMKAYSNRKTDLLVFVGNEGKQHFEQNFSRSVPTAVFRLGVPPQAELAPFSETCQLSILSFSYLSPIKRVEKIAEALALLPDTMQVRWVHIGDGVMREDVHSAAKRLLSERDNIEYHFLGAMDNAVAMQYIAKTQFDFLMNVSASEGIPVTMMESMSFGIPVIGTKVGGVGEIVRHGENGFLLSGNADAKEISDIICQYSRLTFAEKRRMRDCAYATWAESYNAEKNYACFADALLK